MVRRFDADQGKPLRLKTFSYSSRARRGLSDRDVSNIHLESRTLNVLDGITGVLIYDGRSFLQVIEGAEEAVDSLVERLRRDERHVDFVVRDERFVDDRSFTDWSMNLFRVTTGYGEARHEIGPVLPKGTSPELRKLLYRMTDQLAAGL